MFAKKYHTANEAFIDLYRVINQEAISPNGTKKLYNVSILIKNPEQNYITSSMRNWNVIYAQREWNWYLSQNRSVEELKKYAPIWDRMHKGDNIVNSNYGYQWNRNDQLEKTIKQLQDDLLTRQAFITIFDGKDKDDFAFDTPCTNTIGFVVDSGKLCMTVNMRSNDLWFGFCNDQYCFSKLQIAVAKRLGLEVGWYHHHATDMHLYKEHFK
jgi:thymidylate synthase